ncbi:MAG: ATP-binding protein [Verrucomicrobiia bacterium]
MKTIRQRLSANLLIALATLLAITGLIISLLTSAYLENQFNSALLAKAEAIMSLTELNGSRIELEFSDEIMAKYDKGGSDFFEIYRSDGKTVERSRSLGDLHLPIIPQTDEDTAPVFRNMKFPDGRLIKTVTVRFYPQTGTINKRTTKKVEAILIVGSDRKGLDRTISTIQLVLIGCGIVLLSAVFIVVNYVIKRELKPLEKLADEAAKIDAETLNARFTTTSLPGELLLIANRLNESLARLEQSFERERRFSSYIAHELRTPVAELRAIAEYIIAYPDAHSSETDKEILAIAINLDSIIQKLTMLAKAERSDLQTQKQNIKLAPLLSDICSAFKTTINKRNLNLKITANGEIFSDEILIRTILSNLIENAVEYSPEGETIKIESIEKNGFVNINITNKVSDLTDEDIKHFFERFWRKDKARSPSSHIGLGLNLSKAIADMLGYKLTASLNNSELTILISNIPLKSN